MSNKVLVDLGCGDYKKQGFVGLDIMPTTSTDIVCDFETESLPFEDNSVDEFNATHTLEHIKNLLWLMDEVYRCLKVGGVFTVEVPLFPDTGAIKDPTHVRFFVPESFDYFDRNWDYEKRPDYGNRKFDVLRKEILGTSPYRVLSVVLRK